MCRGSGASPELFSEFRNDRFEFLNHVMVAREIEWIVVNLLIRYKEEWFERHAES